MGRVRICTILRLFSALNRLIFGLRVRVKDAIFGMKQEEGIPMLRFGLMLLLASSFGVTMRSLEYIDFAGPGMKILCALLSLGAIACFLGTYCVAEFAHSKIHAHK